jgi:hypothetical protein
MAKQKETKEVVTADVRKHFISRLRKLAEQKTKKIKDAYQKISGEQIDYRYNDRYYDAQSGIKCSTLVTLIKEGKITVADIDFTKILDNLRENPDDIFLEGDAIELFKANILKTAKAYQRKEVEQTKKLRRAAEKTIAQIEHEVAKIEDQVYFGKGSGELRKLLQDFAKKEFVVWS